MAILEDYYLISRKFELKRLLRGIYTVSYSAKNIPIYSEITLFNVLTPSC